MAPTASNPKAEGSGTSWKASPTGSSNPEAKVLCAPPGVISMMLPLPTHDTNRFCACALEAISRTAADNVI